MPKRFIVYPVSTKELAVTIETLVDLDAIFVTIFLGSWTIAVKAFFLFIAFKFTKAMSL